MKVNLFFMGEAVCKGNIKQASVKTLLQYDHREVIYTAVIASSVRVGAVIHQRANGILPPISCSFKPIVKQMKIWVRFFNDGDGANLLV